MHLYLFRVQQRIDRGKGKREREKERERKRERERERERERKKERERERERERKRESEYLLCTRRRHARRVFSSVCQHFVIIPVPANLLFQVSEKTCSIFLSKLQG